MAFLPVGNPVAQKYMVELWMDGVGTVFGLAMIANDGVYYKHINCENDLTDSERRELGLVVDKSKVQTCMVSSLKQIEDVLRRAEARVSFTRDDLWLFK